MKGSRNRNGKLLLMLREAEFIKEERSLERMQKSLASYPRLFVQSLIAYWEPNTVLITLWHFCSLARFLFDPSDQVGINYSQWFMTHGHHWLLTMISLILPSTLIFLPKAWVEVLFFKHTHTYTKQVLDLQTPYMPLYPLLHIILLMPHEQINIKFNAISL